MNLFIEDKDSSFEKHLKDKIESLSLSNNLYILEIYSFISTNDFNAVFVKTNRSDFRGEAFKSEFRIHKTEYETYDSLCWLFFHELGHLILMNSVFEGVMKGAKANHYSKKGFNNEDGIYWDCKGYYNFYEKHHDSDPEEKLVSMFANFIMGKNYDRSWWSKRKFKIKLSHFIRKITFHKRIGS